MIATYHRPAGGRQSLVEPEAGKFCKKKYFVPKSASIQTRQSHYKPLLFTPHSEPSEPRRSSMRAPR